MSMRVPAAAAKPWIRPNQAPLLDDKQVGHIRRIRNLADQLPDDWSGMMGRSSLQEDFGALRFQLAYMAYALGLAHVHRLPAAPALFRKPFEQLITKVLSPDVWTYWHYVSTGNGPLNKSLGELPPRWNPVEVDNIMYSAYVQSMALMFHYLFGDPKYAAEGALTMRLQPLFWGADGQHFSYDERKLNEHLYWTMVQRGYLGIACEPNCVFQICNQVPILGFRLHDMIYGGDVAKEVTDGYLRAWSEFGIIDANGHYNIVVQEREHALVKRPPLPWADFWLGALMHAWNPEFVKTNYPRQIERWSKNGPDGTLWIDPAIPPAELAKNYQTLAIWVGLQPAPPRSATPTRCSGCSLTPTSSSIRFGRTALISTSGGMDGSTRGAGSSRWIHTPATRSLPTHGSTCPMACASSTVSRGTRVISASRPLSTCLPISTYAGRTMMRTAAACGSIYVPAQAPRAMAKSASATCGTVAIGLCNSMARPSGAEPPSRHTRRAASRCGVRTTLC